MISIVYGICGTVFVVLLAWIIRNKYKAEQFRKKRNAYVNGLRIGGTVSDEYKKYFTINEERYLRSFGTLYRYVSGVIHLKKYDYTIIVHNNIVKELIKKLR